MGTGIGAYVRERRQQLGLSQSQLARRVGKPYSQSDVSRLERGEVDLPRLRTLSKLASALEVSVGNLLIAAGWFDDRHVAPTFTVIEQDPLMTVLTKFEVELATIVNLERQVQTRSNRLRGMIQELNAMSGLAVTMPEQEHHG